MKRVFSNKTDVAILWARQLQNDARTAGSGNFYFERKTIYSYGSHFPIARVDGNGNCLFTLKGYSNTTARHINETGYAARKCNLNIIYCWDIDSKESSLSHWKTIIRNLISELGNKRNRNIAGRIHTLRCNIEQLERYCSYMNITLDFEFATIVSFCKGNEQAQLVEKIRSQEISN